MTTLRTIGLWFLFVAGVLVALVVSIYIFFRSLHRKGRAFHKWGSVCRAEITTLDETLGKRLAGAARVSITPLEADIPTQLGGYGERNGQPATGVHDTIYAKVIVMKSGDTLAALVGLDICTTPWSLLEDTVNKAGVPGLTTENVLLSASHDHGGLEGMAMDRNNVLGNPHIGIFSEAMLDFVSDRVAAALKEAAARLEPVTAGTGVALSTAR